MAAFEKDMNEMLGVAALDSSFNHEKNVRKYGSRRHVTSLEGTYTGVHGLGRHRVLCRDDDNPKLIS